MFTPRTRRTACMHTSTSVDVWALHIAVKKAREGGLE
jgi:hypothetical protein